MTRGIIDQLLKAKVFAKYGNECYICGYSLKPVLRVHHMIPVSLGGADSLDNLILLCGNCHTLTHFFSSKKYQDREISRLLVAELNDESVKKLTELIGKIHQARNEVEKNGNLWAGNSGITQTAYEIGDAVESVAKKNKFSIQQKELLLNALESVLENIPNNVSKKCSYRLLDNGRCISINLIDLLQKSD